MCSTGSRFDAIEDGSPQRLTRNGKATLREYHLGLLAQLAKRPVADVSGLRGEALELILQFAQSQIETGNPPPFPERAWQRYRSVGSAAMKVLRAIGWVAADEFPGLELRCSNVLLAMGFKASTDVARAIAAGDFGAREVRIDGEWRRFRNYGPATRRRILQWSERAGAK